MEFCLLGPMETWAAGSQVSIGDRKRRLLLAILLLEPNHLVPIDRLVELLWTDAPPPSARRTVQAHLSRLRVTLARAGGADEGVSLVRYGTGYQLVCDRLSIDAHRFRTLVDVARSTADDHSRAAQLDRALDLWRGPALADVGTDDVRHLLTGGLHAVRLAAIEERVETYLRLGRHGQLVGELTDLAARYPHRQRITAALMHSLYRLGGTADALAAYHNTRRLLSEELGLEPPTELQQLHVAILRGEPPLQIALPGSAS